MTKFRTFLRLAPLALLAGCVAATPGDDGDLRAYYRVAEENMLAQGKLRTDVDPADAPFTYADLEKDFVRIALYDEYSVRSGRFVAGATPALLRRWESPVRIAVIPGASVPASQRQRDTDMVREFTRRLARISGLDMRLVPESQANMLVLFMDAAERAQFAAGLQERFPRVEQAVVDAIGNSPPNTFCAAFAFPSDANPGVYDFSLILVKAEHSNLMRESCVHEEMAQALGLTNDSPTARPSIFNDDEEFAFLTLHDEILLKMLYDRRLRAGMKADEVIPLLPEIARDAARALGGPN